MKRTRFAASILVLSLLQPIAAFAAGQFSDVGDKHPFKGEIESLARSGVLKGNPDGNFYPERQINRAEFLKMLYVATNRKPKLIYGKCFSDVEIGSWYEAYVCDAASKEHAFVAGYSDGKFRPASPVSRVEALKMAFMLFNLDAPSVTEKDKDLIKFVDISVSAWYSKYISAAYLSGMLPIAGQSGSRMDPEKPLLRGEAAAYIFNAQKAYERQIGLQQKAMLSSSSMSSSAKSAAGVVDAVKNATFPFNDSATFVAKRPIAYLFTLTEKTPVFIQVAVSGYYPADVSCRLYLLSDNDFSNEYYLGFQENGKCTLKLSAIPGKYQLQIQPTIADVPFTLTTKRAASDGNDGFSDAVNIKSNTPRTGTLEPADLFDWYTFTIDKEQTATVEVSAAEKLECIIYTPSTVDQFGFSGPECGKSYLFQPGDPVQPYYIGIGRRTGDSMHKVTYTVKFRP